MLDDFDCGLCPEEFEDDFLYENDREMHPENYE